MTMPTFKTTAALANVAYGQGWNALLRPAPKLPGMKTGNENEITPANDDIRQTIFVEGIGLLLPGQVIDNEAQLDVQMSSLDNDIKMNVTRQAFLTQWNAFHMAWTTWFGDNKSTASVLITGMQNVWDETERYRNQLRVWLTTYKTETGKPPTLATVPDAPPKDPGAKPPPPWFMTLSTSTYILMGLGAAVLLGGGGYLWYRAMQSQKAYQKEILPLILPALGGGGGGGAASRAMVVHGS